MLDPDSGKALFFGATVAARRGDLPLARERFAQAADAESARERASAHRAADPRCSMRSSPGRPLPRPPAPGRARGGCGPSSVRVNDQPGRPPYWSGNSRAPLFVFVRRAGEGGPPLAAKRLESQFPQAVTLTPADAMIPGRTFARRSEVQVVARIARSGNPVGGQRGPVRGSHLPGGAGRPPELVIDQLTP